MESSSHPEWSKENSLTSPEDRDRVNKWRPEQAQSLTESQSIEAVKELNNTSFTDKFQELIEHMQIQVYICNILV